MAQAAPGEIVQAPLSQAVNVKPNISLILDDSGSMRFEDTLNQGVESLGLAPSDSAQGYSGVYQVDDECQEWMWYGRCRKTIEVAHVNDSLSAQLGTCRGFNVLAYNPQVTYRPWPGHDKASFSGKDKLFYLHWDDNGNGEYDVGECGLSKRNYKFEFDERHIVTFKEMSAAKKQNYANWFEFYRNRMKVAQSAFLELVEKSNARIGFDTIHNRRSVPINDLSKQHIENISKSIVGSEGKGNTPLRSALIRTGEYFRGNDSPILGETEGGMCQQNYAVLMSDGYYDLESAGSFRGIGNVDDGSDTYIRKSDRDKVDNTLADVAMKYYINDLSPLANRVPIISGLDENTRQHMVTYTVGFGVNGTLDSNPTNPDAPFSGWPEGPTSRIAQSPRAVDDMRHAAWNSRGKFLSATDPQKLIQALNDIAGEISSRSINTGSLGVVHSQSNIDNALIQTQYDPQTWSGDVVLRKVDSNGQLQKPLWSLATYLSDVNIAKRNVYTINARNQVFLLNNNNIAMLSETQSRDLENSSVKRNRNYLMSLIDYLRGDRALEGDIFRQRPETPLGDIVNSYPIVVEEPTDSYPENIADASYATFREENADRTPILYIGANDGLLHAVNVRSGHEVFAFMPHGVFEREYAQGISWLADKNYNHRYYVDASPVARDAYLQLEGDQEPRWHTVLLGGLGAGGKSVYMLDVTNPDNFDDPQDTVKWEFSNDDLGLTFSDIEVAKLADGRWYAIFGNGYNAEGSGEEKDSDGTAKLFVVDLEDPASYAKIDTGIGHMRGGQCGSGKSDCNGLSSPELADINGDGVYDWVYAGDLHGNLWAFDLTDFTVKDPASVPITRLFASCLSSADSPACAKENRQPITTRVAVVRNPGFANTIDTPNVNVFWGTGQLLTLADLGDNRVQSFYSVLHSGKEEGWPAYTRNDLVDRHFTTFKGQGESEDARVVNGSKGVDYLHANKHGWYINLDNIGERLITTPIIYGDLITFNTAVPRAGGPCQTGSRGWVNALSLYDGLAPQRNNTPPVYAQRQIFDYNEDGEFSAEDLVDQKKDEDGNIVAGKIVTSIRLEGKPTSSRFIGDTQYIGVAGGQGEGLLTRKIQAITALVPGRTSWYQLR